ncbi:hypothetical protein ACOME3_004533 [Neoechinorhynchus agilis]
MSVADELCLGVGEFRLISRQTPEILSDGKDAEWYRQFLSDLPIMPDIVFPKNRLIVEHRYSGFVVSFEALNALADTSSSPDVQLPFEWRPHDSFKSAERDMFDWTFSTNFNGDLRGPRTFYCCEQKELNLEPFNLAASDPSTIHHFKHIILYEDEMADNGAVICDVRYRVEHCKQQTVLLLVLFRWMFRVNGVLCRSKETRYCYTGGNQIFRQVSLSEIPFDGKDEHQAIYELIKAEPKWRKIEKLDLGEPIPPIRRLNTLIIPSLGYGTYKICNPDHVKNAIKFLADEMTTILIDTAEVYKNEEIVGKCIKESNM